jgi:hypothetical protein
MSRLALHGWADECVRPYINADSLLEKLGAGSGLYNQGLRS